MSSVDLIFAVTSEIMNNSAKGLFAGITNLSCWQVA